MESKRLILAIVLSMAVWFLWMTFFSPKTPVPPVKEDTGIITNENADKNIVKQDIVEQSDLQKPISSIKIQPANIKEATYSINTDKYRVTFSNKGAVIKSLIYKDRDVELVIPYAEKNVKGVMDFAVYFSESEFLKGNSLQDTIWNYSTMTQDVVRFSTNLSLNGKLQLQKTYRLNKEGYYFQIEYSFINTGNKSITFPNNSIIFSSADFLGPDMDFDNRYNQLSQIYYLNDSFKKVQKGSGFFSKAGIIKKESGDVKWSGIMGRYFLLIMLADGSDGTSVLCDNRQDYGYRSGMLIPANIIQPGEKFVKSFKIYAGEKDKEKLTAVDPSLRDAADVSKWIEPIRDLLLWCLKKINLLFGNFGWSLVVFSILTKIILLPLTQKSTESMKRMQALTPKMNELKEKYKGKPDVLNKEMMKLYKSNKVNPMGGCLPLILQMPFFFALWSALINSIDLWQAPFIFWIHDLSLPDTVYKISGFNINILPIIMTAVSFLQQKLTTGGAAGQQQKMMMFMPLIFVVIFWNMPSGLVLYWTLQNAMQVLHQLYTNRKVEKEA